MNGNLFGDTGLHLTVDLYGCKETTLQDPNFLENVIFSAVKKADMNFVDMYSILYDKHESNFGWGWSFNCILSDSHINIHTAPSKNRSAFIDVYSCKYFDKNDLVDLFIEGFKPVRYYISVLERNFRLGENDERQQV